MKLLTAFLVAASASTHLFFFANAAAMLCEDFCNFELGANVSCTEAIETMEFSGDCCSLKEVDGVCTLLTNSDGCYFQEKDADGAQYDENGNVIGYLIPGTELFGQEGLCPESDFNIPTQGIILQEVENGTEGSTESAASPSTAATSFGLFLRSSLSAGVVSLCGMVW